MHKKDNIVVQVVGYVTNVIKANARVNLSMIISNTAMGRSKVGDYIHISVENEN